MFNNNKPLRSTTYRDIRCNPEAVLTRLRLVYFGAVGSDHDTLTLLRTESRKRL
jgi:hypothetical protein